MQQPVASPRSVIVGLGRTGVSAARHLAARGHRLVVTDSRENPPGLADLRRLVPAAATALGGFDPAVLEGADQVVVSPGVSLAEPFLRKAAADGLDLVGDIELFAREAGGRVVGITGTNGKSTVTTLVGEFARAAGLAVRVGGNLGEPALDLLEGPPAAMYVLELSSYQLETTHSLQLEAAAVLNVTPDHLDRYRDLAGYAAAKARIFERAATAIVNLDDDIVVRMPRPGQRTVGFSLRRGDADFRLLAQGGESWLAAGAEPLLPLAALRLPGRHNAANALAALAVGSVCGFPREAMTEVLARFGGLPHRAERVRDWRGIAFIDDSKGTNVGATVAALDGLDGPAGPDRGRGRQGPGLLAARSRLQRQGKAGRSDRARRASARRRARRPLRRRLRRLDGGRGRHRRRDRPRRRHGPAVAGLRELRHVPRLRAARRGVRGGGTGIAGMSVTSALQYSRSAGRQQRLALDPVIIGTVFGLLLAGLVMVASASVSIAARQAADPFYYFDRQAFSVLLGCAFGAAMLVVPISAWRKVAPWLLVLSFALLVAVAIPGIGHEVNGSRRWLRFGPVNFQPSELARWFLVTYVAIFAIRHQTELRSTADGFFKALAVLVAAATLLLFEPDFGAAVVLCVTGTAVLFVAGARMREFLLVCGAGLAGIAVLAVTSPYRLKRILAFLNPWDDPFDSGFQLTQSLIAIGRGEWFGVGLGSSIQKLFYLPEAHTDFVFAVLAEEFGLLGVLVIVAGFLVLVLRSLRLSRIAADAGMPLHACLAAGFGVWIGLQAFLNMGVNMGLLPTKGLTLPLLSYGRSSMLVTLAWVGMLLRVHHEVVVSGKSAIPAEGRAP